MDINLQTNLDFDLTSDEGLTEQMNNDTTLLTMLFSDSRVNDKRGHWNPIETSEVWTFEQRRSDLETSRELKEVVEIALKEIEHKGKLYARTEVNVKPEDGIMILDIQAFGREGLVLDRRFVI